MVTGNGEPIVMDKAYEDEETRRIARECGYEPIVPPKKIRLEPWEYDRDLYRRRNETERFFFYVFNASEEF